MLEKQERAYELALSALLGDGLYNFGELVREDVMNRRNVVTAGKLIGVLKSFNILSSILCEHLLLTG